MGFWVGSVTVLNPLKKKRENRNAWNGGFLFRKILLDVSSHSALTLLISSSTFYWLHFPVNAIKILFESFFLKAL